MVCIVTNCDCKTCLGSSRNDPKYAEMNKRIDAGEFLMGGYICNCRCHGENKMTEPEKISEFVCDKCGTKCRVMKKDKDMWIEPVAVIPFAIAKDTLVHEISHAGGSMSADDEIKRICSCLRLEIDSTIVDDVERRLLAIVPADKGPVLHGDHSDAYVRLKEHTDDLEKKVAHLMDVYQSLGIKWGDDPFTVIEGLKKK